MIFWILSVASLLLTVCVVYTVYQSFVDGEERADAIFTLFLCVCILNTPILMTWTGHAKDLGTIDAQHEIITIYQERVDRLNQLLNEFQYPAGSLLNADSPVAAIVKSLSEAENKLAEAKEEKARAIRSIEQRRHGAMSGVITLVGDYK